MEQATVWSVSSQPLLAPAARNRSCGARVQVLDIGAAAPLIGKMLSCDFSERIAVCPPMAHRVNPGIHWHRRYRRIGGPRCDIEKTPTTQALGVLRLMISSYL